MSTDDRNPLEVLADSQAELNQLVTLDQSTKAFLKATWVNLKDAKSRFFLDLLPFLVFRFYSTKSTGDWILSCCQN